MQTSDLVKINKDVFIKAASVSAKTAIFAALPYLNVPPINFIINKAVDWIVGTIANSLETLAFFTYIDFRVSQQGKDYVLAAHAADTLQTEESRRKADEAFKRFIRLTN